MYDILHLIPPMTVDTYIDACVAAGANASIVEQLNRECDSLNHRVIELEQDNSALRSQNSDLKSIVLAMAGLIHHA